jgi:hypothetical protein
MKSRKKIKEGKQKRHTKKKQVIVMPNGKEIRDFYLSPAFKQVQAVYGAK